MTFDEKLLAALRTKVERARPHPAPASTTRPYVTFQRINGRRHATLNSGAGAPRGTFQVDVWADSSQDARRLADELADALPRLLKVGDLTENSDDYETDTKLHRASFDVVLWH